VGAAAWRAGSVGPATEPPARSAAPPNCGGRRRRRRERGRNGWPSGPSRGVAGSASPAVSAVWLASGDGEATGRGRLRRGGRWRSRSVLGPGACGATGWSDGSAPVFSPASLDGAPVSTATGAPAGRRRRRRRRRRSGCPDGAPPASVPASGADEAVAASLSGRVASPDGLGSLGGAVGSLGAMTRRL
jgi:hypothetical protein